MRILRQVMFIVATFVGWPLAFGAPQPARSLVYSSTSFDGGWVEISLGSDGNASVKWSRDPFRHGGPKLSAWQVDLHLPKAETNDIFQALDAADFLSLKDGRRQVPDESSVAIAERKLGAELHSVKFSPRETPESLHEVLSRLVTVYERAKKRNLEKMPPPRG